MKPMRPMPDDFREMQAQLGYMKRLCQHYGAGDSTVIRWMKEAGLQNARRIKHPVPADLAEVAAVNHALGIAAHYNVCRNVVRRWIADTGIKPASTHGEANARFRPIPKDFATLAPTMTATALRKHYVATWTTVQRWADETGAHPLTIDRTKRTGSKVKQLPRRGMVHAMGLSSNITAARMHTVHDIAADVLRRAGFYVWRCKDSRGLLDNDGKLWRVGNTVLDGDELLAKAERYRSKCA